VEAVSANVTIADDLTYTLTADFRVTRAAGIESVQWTSHGDVLPALPTDGGLPSDDHFLLLELVEKGTSKSTIRGAYSAPYCSYGFGLSISTTQCTNIPAKLNIGGVVPKELVLDGPDIPFGYVMTRL